MTRNHKAISFVMALVFCLSFMAPLMVAPQTAEAAATLTALSVPTVNVNTTSTVGTVRVEDTLATITNGTRITVTLVGGNEWTAALAPTAADLFISTDVAVAAGDVNKLSGATFTVTQFDSMATIDVANVNAAGNVSVFEINFGRNGRGVQLDIEQSGDIIVGVAINGGVLAYTEVVVGKTGTGATTTKGLAHPSVSAGANRALGDIQISENIAGAITAGTEIGITLPDGITWDASMDNIANFASSTNGPQVDPASIDIGTSSRGLSQLEFSIATASTVAGFIVISNVLVDIEDDFDNGDIEATVKKLSGDGVTTGTAWIGVKGDYTISVEQGAETVPTLYAGQWGVEPGTILISESTAGSLVQDRSITVELPTNCYWSAAPEIDVQEGDIVLANNDADLSDNARKATWMVQTASGSSSVLSIEDGEIAIIGDADAGALDAVVGGYAGAEGTVTIADIAEPVTATVDPVTDIIIGLKNQDAGTITITEAEAGLLLANCGAGGLVDGVLVLDLPEGCSWAVAPDVEVTTGDLKIDVDNVTRSNESNQLNLPIDTSSDDTPSVITISGVQITSNRVVPEGTIVVGVRGPALDEERERTAGTVVNVSSFVLANCVTPAPSETVAEYNATFSLGSTIYYVNGLAKMMDVACFAQDNRMFVPQRYLGLALGVAEENIVWDSATQTASFTTTDGKVATCVVGSNILTFDGVETTMDVKPLVVDNRIFLPARFLTEAMGGTVGWDQASQTAFVNISV